MIISKYIVFIILILNLSVNVHAQTSEYEKNVMILYANL